MAAETAIDEEGRAAGQQEQEQQEHLLQLLDALYFEPGGLGSGGRGGAAALQGRDAGALASLKQQLLQHLPAGGAQLEAVGREAAALAPSATMAAEGGERLEQQQPDPMRSHRPAPAAQQRQPQLQRPPSLSAFELLMLQAEEQQQQQQQRQQEEEEEQQQQARGSQLALQQQPSPPAFLSQADDNMAALPQLAPASQQGEAGEGAAGGASPHAFLLGTEASQPDPLQQAMLQPQQELQRELLERREQQRERRRQQQEQAQQAAAVAAAAAAAAPEQQAQAGVARESEADDLLRGRQLAAASDAAFHFLWRLLGEAWAAELHCDVWR